ncbi:TetR/AcrR family transcriptional regulator [Roseobacter denitrificans]|nr:TetR/AcrR family transcriptional regulator [Roseobacter denitrificans]
MSDIAKAAGISRQALYLHFQSRADLLIAATRHLDTIKDVDARMAASRAAATGQARLTAFVKAWGDYIPEIYQCALALRAMRADDPEAAAALDDRMQAVREGCAAAVAALDTDAALRPELSKETATDIIWTMLSVETWEQLTQQCGWAQDQYIALMQALTARAVCREDYHT